MYSKPSIYKLTDRNCLPRENLQVQTGKSASKLAGCRQVDSCTSLRGNFTPGNFSGGKYFPLLNFPSVKPTLEKRLA